MQTYEVEVKSLLGSAERTEEVRSAMKKADPKCRLESKNIQLNHYFIGGNLSELVQKITPHLSPELVTRLKDLIERATSFSVRSRKKDGSTSFDKTQDKSLTTGGTVFLVLKVSVDDTTSANGISRMEFEEKISLTLAELDGLIHSAGFSYEAKWSRMREEYVCLGTNVTLDRNAGYGWVAEFERMVNDPTEVDKARMEIRQLMAQLGVEELLQARLERMFAFYNKNWQEYYGTDKIFVIE